MGKRELQTQELMPCVTGDEKKFQVAIQSQFIKNASFESVKECLRLVMMKVGVRANNLPNDLEKLVLYEHIVSNFGGNRLDEIKLAFDMAISGRLDVEVNCYENFSCYYFSSIMNAYKNWAAQAYRNSIEPKQEKPPQKIFSNDELDSSSREAVQRQYLMFLKGYEIYNQENNRNILEKDGLIKNDETVLDFYNRMKELKKPNIYVQVPA